MKKTKYLFNLKIKSAILNSFLGLFCSLKSKFSIDNFIAKEIYEISFRDYFNLYLKSHITQVEKLRIYNLKILKFSIFIILGLASFTYYDQIYLKKNTHNLWIFFVVLILIIIFLANHLNQSFINTYKKNFLQNLFKFFGENFNYNANGTNLFKRYQEFNILPKFDEQICESFDLITAKNDDFHMAIQNIILKNKDIISKKNPKFNHGNQALMHQKNIPEFINIEKVSKICEGIAFLVEFETKFNSKTIIKQNHNHENPDPQNLTKIQTHNENFNKNFVVFSDTGLEFNQLFSQEFMSSCFELLGNFRINKKTIGSINKKQIYLSIFNNSMLIFIERQEPIFSPSNLVSQLNLVEESKKIISEINSVLKIINAIKKIYSTEIN